MFSVTVAKTKSPVHLIAANVGALRDQAQSDGIEKLSLQNEKTAEMADLAELVRSMHVSVTALVPTAGAALVGSTPPLDQPIAQPSTSRRRRNSSSNSRH
jgi:hypothetical protein